MKFLYVLLFLLSFSAFGQDYAQNELLIQTANHSSQHNLGRHIEDDYNLTIKSVELVSAPMRIYLVKFNQNINHGELIKQLRQDKLILNAQNNHFVTSRETIPNDTDFNDEQWYFKNTGQTGGTVDADIDATEAWDISTGGTTTHDDTIVVCIIEGGGVDINHADLAGNIWKNYAEIPDNDIDDDNNGYVDDYLGWNVSSNDDNVFNSSSHGTRVAGMIGAEGNNNLGITGVNHKVKMMVVKGQSASNEASVIAAYTYPLEMRKTYNSTYGQQGAFVVVTNASWGINNGDPADSPLWCAMYDTLGKAGIINIGATTNNNTNVDINGDMPTTCPSKFLIGVSMTNSNDILDESGYGPIHVDLAAPGKNVYLTMPGDIYTTTSGTSFATPCVSGAVALLYATPCPEFINFTKYHPDSAALKVRELILDEVDPITSLSTQVASGGRLNINNSMTVLNASCDAGACLLPYNFYYSNLTDSVVDIFWEGFSTDYLFYIKEGSLPMVEIPITANNQMSFDTLTPCTNYTVYVKAVCGAQQSDFSYALNFRTDGCCENPILTIANAEEESLEIAWQNVLYATNYDLRYKIVGTTNWTTINNTNSNVIAPALEPCTDYEFQIKTECADSTHGFSDAQIFRTKGCGACFDLDYCPISGADYSLEWLDTVKIGNQTSGTGSNAGWLIDESEIFSFEAGGTYNITMIPGYASTHYTEKFSVWIDINQDGTFDNSEKLVNELTNNGPVNGLLILPAATLDGITKMRIAMMASSSGNAIACQSTNFYGEFEDYCVYIGDDAGTTENNLAFTVYPNPTATTLNIKSNHQIDFIEIRSIDGKVLKAEKFSSTQIDVSDFTNGIYFITVYGVNTQSTIKFVKQ